MPPVPHALADLLRFEDGPIGPRAIVTTPRCDAEVYLHGAHVTRYAPRGRGDLLYLSPLSSYADGKAIRGGIPVVFPWFGERSDGKPGPAHGYARTSRWRYVEARRLEEDVELVLALEHEGLAASLRVRAGAVLDVELEVHNGGSAASSFEAALHTYLRVGDVRRAEIVGLAGSTYLDKTDGARRHTTGPAPLRIARETDQVHLGTDAACTLLEGGRPLVEVAKRGAPSTVVWNPWIDKTRTMADLPPDAWQGFVCIEAGAIADDRITLAAGATHRLATTLRPR